MEGSSQVFKADSENTHTCLTYFEALALALVGYAREDREFAKSLAAVVDRENLPLTLEPPARDFQSVKILLPHDSKQAQTRAKWLCSLPDFVSGTNEAKALLAAWAKQEPKPEPRSLVVGIAGFAIPGITLGLIKRKVTMGVVLAKEKLQSERFDLARQMTQASHRVLAQALAMVDADMRRLDPDMAEWFLGKQQLAFYHTSQSQLSQMVSQLEDLEIAHEAICGESGRIEILAISPAVNRSRASWQLELAEKLNS